MTSSAVEYVDVLIIGAGISGIDAAYRIHEKNPDLTYMVLERRERLGGTWDLFRYPGVRSDSDIFTLSFPFEPWQREEAIADGHDIWQYLADTADKHHITDRIRFNTYVLAADWDSNTDTWTVRAEQDGAEKVYQCRFVYFGTGYYNYDHPYTPEFRGTEDFRGEVVHPQHWPESLDYTGKKVVVIGSGATAISLIPALTEKAGHVTMLQRSPTYLYSSKQVDPMSNWFRKLLPPKLAYWLIRWRFALFYVLTYQFAQRAPAMMKRYLRRTAVDNLPPGYDVDTHFKPRYDPWDQRLCLILDGDVYKTIAEGRADVVTDHIDHFDATGIELQSGRHIDADIIVTATGLRLQALGGITVSLDGDKVNPHDRFVYKGYMLDDVPNLAWCIGYTNASWTLRADMNAESVAKLLAHMTSHGYTHAYPHLRDKNLPEKPTWDLQAGYVLRSSDVLPKSSIHRPWNMRHNYLLDSLDHRFDRLEESMVFGRAAAEVEQPA
ncbi:MAG: flavin-containing monooxygenase [Candidatus Sericytochromatia bacterium]